jgi:ABC-type transport system involved in multi-copper enzyme maturation permease subunit
MSTPTVSSPPVRRRSALGPIVRFTLRSCVPPKRRVGMLVPCAGALLFGLLALLIDDARNVAFARIAADGIFALIVPLAALVIGDAVLGAEIRSGTFHFTWMSPVPMWQVVLGRWIGGCIVAGLTLVPACALAAFVAGAPGAAGAAALGAAMASVSYVAVFVAVGCIAKRAAVWSLAIVFLVERLLGLALTGIAQLSPTWESRAIFLAYAPDVPDTLVRDGIPQGAGAIVRLLMVTAVMLGLAIWRLPRLQLAGAAD